MILKQKQLASLCGVKPPAISDLLNRGILHSIERKIDMSDPANMAYLQKHNPKIAQDILDGIDPFSSGGPVSPETRHSVRGPKPSTENKSQKQTEKPKKAIDTMKLASIKAEKLSASNSDEDRQAQQQSGYIMSYEEEVVSKRAFYEAEKIKNDAALKALELDKRNGTVIETEVVLGIMTNLSGAIQKGFLDVIPKQALMICSRLGVVGREAEVEDLIAEDNTRAIEDIKQIVDAMSRVKWGVRNSRIDKAESETETE